jgi:hypothetical protein
MTSENNNEDDDDDNEFDINEDKFDESIPEVIILPKKKINLVEEAKKIAKENKDSYYNYLKKLNNNPKLQFPTETVQVEFWLNESK